MRVNEVIDDGEFVSFHADSSGDVMRFRKTDISGWWVEHGQEPYAWRRLDDGTKIEVFRSAFTIQIGTQHRFVDDTERIAVPIAQFEAIMLDPSWAHDPTKPHKLIAGVCDEACNLISSW